MRIYLAGPIFGQDDTQAKGWRDQVKRNAAPHTFLDPMRRDCRGREANPGMAKLLVELDKRDVESCDVLLANMHTVSAGTCMEILLAWQLGKTVVVVWPDETPLSPWVRYHASAVVPTIDEAMRVIAWGSR